MKRIIAAAVIAVFIALLCVGSGMIINRNFEQIKDMLENSKQVYKSDGALAAADKVAVLENKWIKTELFVSMFTNHDKIDAIHITITRMHAYALSDNYSGFLSEANELNVLIEQLEADEKITMHSVF